MVVVLLLDFINIPKDMMRIHMHLLPKTLTCTMEGMLDMEITSSLVLLTNSNSR
jgi:hypothetical protein